MAEWRMAIEAMHGAKALLDAPQAGGLVGKNVGNFLEDLKDMIDEHIEQLEAHAAIYRATQHMGAAAEKLTLFNARRALERTSVELEKACEVLYSAQNDDDADAA